MTGPVKDTMKGGGGPQPRIGGVILAGGASRRMGGQHKALIELRKRSLIDHVIARFQPQVDSLVLSVAFEDPVWERFGLKQVADGRSDSLPDPRGTADTRRPLSGPLAGLLAGMESLHEQHEWILLAPCDAPFVPLDLGEQLLGEAQAQGTMVCIAVYEDNWQPTFSIWHRGLLPLLHDAVRVDGLGGFKEFLRRVDFAQREWQPAAIPPFFNINTAQDLGAAQALLP